MFKGKVHLYKNVDGKEEEVKKEFDNEKEFNAYIDKNPDLKELRDFKWESIKWPSIPSFNHFFEEAKRLGKTDILEEIEKDMKVIFDKSKKLIGK